MMIRFKKGMGGPDTLTCIRDDGSCTWSALNFSVHDFGHYAIETTLGFRQAFFGLIARGWAIDDFSMPDSVTGQKPLVPCEAIQAEAVAGLLDMERRSQRQPGYAEFVAMLDSVCEGLGVPRPALTTTNLAAIRRREAETLQQWRQLAAGDVMELDF